MRQDKPVCSACRRGLRAKSSYLLINALLILVVPVFFPLPAFANETDAAAVTPNILSLLPAVIAISFALLLRQVIPAIFAGLLAGAILVRGLSPIGIWQGLLDTVGIYTLDALADRDHISIVIFALMIGGLVGIISRNGGMSGIVHFVSMMATTRQRGQIATSLLGTAIFFDDYANTMVVGNTMRPITDRLRISREKLAYLVDSTAAPIASLALVTTWIGFQVGLIDEATKDLEGISASAYAIFLNALPYGFYSILAIVFVYLVAASGRDFGPMLRAEQEVTLSPPVDGETASGTPDTPPRLMNALLPLGILVLGTLGGIYWTGRSGLPPTASLQDIIGNGNSYLAMLWSSTLAVIIAIALSLASRTLTLEKAIHSWMEGVSSLLPAIIILTLAWALAGVNEALHTAEYLSATLSGQIVPGLLPSLIFVLAAAIAFATGSSWGVMGILIPLTMPLTWAVLAPTGVDIASSPIFLASIAALLSGAVWGDHCSPISDTTILSSMASGCDHIAHVKTQLPYALIVGGVAILAGSLPAGFGMSVWLCLAAGVAILVAVIGVFGKSVKVRQTDQLVETAQSNN